MAVAKKKRARPMCICMRAREAVCVTLTHRMCAAVRIRDAVAKSPVRCRPPAPVAAAATAPRTQHTSTPSRHDVCTHALLQGRTLEVLVEGPNPKNPAQAFGRIRHNKLVYFDGDGKTLRGQLVMVRVDECNAFSMFGEMVEVVGARAAQPGQGQVVSEAQAQAQVLAAV